MPRNPKSFQSQIDLFAIEMNDKVEVFLASSYLYNIADILICLDVNLS